MGPEGRGRPFSNLYKSTPYLPKQASKGGCTCPVGAMFLKLIPKEECLFLFHRQALHMLDGDVHVCTCVCVFYVFKTCYLPLSTWKENFNTYFLVSHFLSQRAPTLKMDIRKMTHTSAISDLTQTLGFDLAVSLLRQILLLTELLHHCVETANLHTSSSSSKDAMHHVALWTFKKCCFS